MPPLAFMAEGELGVRRLRQDFGLHLLLRLKGFVASWAGPPSRRCNRDTLRSWMKLTTILKLVLLRVFRDGGEDGTAAFGEELLLHCGLAAAGQRR